MPFTIHPNQKPSDDEKYWKRYIEEVETRSQAAAVECHAHAENVRVARRLFGGNNPEDRLL